MKTTKRLIALQYNYYKELEQKLENYAREGLILKKSSGAFWTFEKAEPQNLKYTVTYFKEASIFNPEHTDNQLTYFDYAKESGWDFVSENGQMQIFSSSLENPVPFETDDNEMLENIHTCMKKSFIPSQIIMLFVWVLNLVVKVPLFVHSPMDFLADKLQISTLVLMLMACVFSAYTLLNYYSWYKQSKQSIALGGEIKSYRSAIKKVYERCHVIGIFALVFYLFANLFRGTHWGIIAIAVMQVPVFVAVFWGAIHIQKRLKIPAKINKIVTFSIYGVTGVLYCAFAFFMIASFDFHEPTEKEYSVVQWSFADGDTHEYRLYQDELLLTCQDLYGEIDYDEYSYEKNTESTFLLTKEEYTQTAPPTKGKPPEISYTIYTSKFHLVNDMILHELLSEDELFAYRHESIENEIFGTKEAYTFYYAKQDEKQYRGEYLLVFDEDIVHLDVEGQLNDRQVSIIKEKLAYR